MEGEPCAFIPGTSGHNQLAKRRPDSTILISSKTIAAISLNICEFDNTTDEAIRELARGLPQLQSLDISFGL